MGRLTHILAHTSPEGASPHCYPSRSTAVGPSWTTSVRLDAPSPDPGRGWCVPQYWHVKPVVAESDASTSSCAEMLAPAGAADRPCPRNRSSSTRTEPIKRDAVILCDSDSVCSYTWSAQTSTCGGSGLRSPSGMLPVKQSVTPTLCPIRVQCRDQDRMSSQIIDSPVRQYGFFVE